jgi:SpoVK/Ycf46/Vps4 family AAA+-type ATPase
LSKYSLDIFIEKANNIVYDQFCPKNEVTSMKSELILRLIESHCTGSEDSFKKAVRDLADDEENKGNLALSRSLRNTYTSDKRRDAAFETPSPLSEMTFSAQNLPQAPKDKDSALDLVEILQPKLCLDNVALPEETRDMLCQIIEEQKKADELLAVGVLPTNRLLFCGPPGCGKTLTAYALAGEIGIPIAYVKLDGLVSSYLGQTGTNIRKIFDFVKSRRIMLFLDEFDAIAKKRDDAHELGELKRVVTTLLQNMDAMPANVFLVAATNHHHLLDPAIWRRFNMSILLELPNDSQRKMIIGRFLQETLVNYHVDSETLIVLTKNMSGAQICSFLQSLARFCVMRNKNREIASEDIAGVWLKQSTLLAREDSETYDNALYELSKAGIALRVLEKISGIPKSTLSYRFNQMEVTHE